MKDVKDYLGKFDAVELFAYLSPGSLFLFSLLLWAKPPDDETGWRGFVLGAVYFLAAYALGVMLAAWASEGTAAYLRGTPATAWGKVVGLPLRLLHWVPIALGGNPDVVRVRLDMVEQLHDRVGVMGLTRLFRTPWGLLEVYRAVAVDELGDKAKAVLAEAQATHRRFRFGLGVALVLSLTMLQALARLAWHYGLGEWGFGTCLLTPLGLIVLALACLGGSLGLRWVAARWWEVEFALTCVLLRAVQAKKPAPAPPAVTADCGVFQVVTTVTMSKADAASPPG